jgi:hypothetical protein
MWLLVPFDPKKKGRKEKTNCLWAEEIAYLPKLVTTIISSATAILS